MFSRIRFVFWGCMLLLAPPAYAAIFNVAPGDVPGLIAAIHAANGNGEADTVTISGLYVLTQVNNYTHGNNGLPAITSAIALNGQPGATIRRSDAPETPAFRILYIDETGSLTMNRVMIANGFVPPTDFDWEGIGGGIFNLGDLSIADSAIVGNVAGDDDGGIAHSGTTFTLRRSIVSANRVTNGQNIGGLGACCSVTISDSTISDNQGIGLLISSGANGHAEVVNSSIVRNNAVGPIGGVIAGGDVVIVNTTIAENVAGGGGPAAIFLHSGVLSLVNVTIANNSTTPSPRSTGGILADPVNAGVVELVNTVLDGNTAGGSPSNCSGGPLTSLGNNVISSTAGCTIALLGSDLVMSAELGPLTDDGVPGHVYHPLLKTSPAIDAGNDQVCMSNPQLSTDQIANPRVGICEIGAIEFQPEPPAVAFAGTPGTPSCHGDSVSALAREHGGLAAAALALGFDNVRSLQIAIREFCRE